VGGRAARRRRGGGDEAQTASASQTWNAWEQKSTWRGGGFGDQL